MNSASIGLINNKKGLFFLVLLLSSLDAFLQTADIKERIVVHTNSEELLTGETLYFSAFVTSAATGKISSMSRVLYVELLDNNNTPVFQTKLLLSEGIGHGKFFISSTLETGNYHLTAYTNWMKNFREFYHVPINIINPYMELTLKDDESKKMDISFFPEGGVLVNTKSNKLAIQVSDKSNSIMGRISDGEDIISEFTTDLNGLATVEFTPGNKRSYQLILNNEGESLVFDLPEACQMCSTIKLSKNSQDIILDLISNDSIHKTATLEIQSMQQVILEKRVRLNSSQIFSDNELPNGLLNAKLTIEGKEQASRIFWNGELPFVAINEARPDSLKFQKNSLVKHPFHLEEESILSITVSPFERQASSSVFSEIINSNVQPQVYQEFQDIETLDRILVTSSWKFKPLKTQEDTLFYLPEIDTDIISGRVSDLNDVPLSHEDVGFFMSGNNSKINIARTNELGIFHVFYDPMHIGKTNIIQILNQRKNVKIEVEKEFYEDYRKLPVRHFNLDSARISTIVQKSIYNQIENAYFENLKETKLLLPSQFEWASIYKLDDYKRFSSLRDTFIEIIPEIHVAKSKTNFEINTVYFDLNQNYQQSRGEQPLILLDGMVVEAEQLLGVSPFLVDEVKVFNKKYYFGSTRVNGILWVKTFDSDLEDVKVKGQKVELVPCQASVEYNFPISKEGDKLPDYRTLLCWESPEWFQMGENVIEFRSSEVSGLYRLVAFGVSRSGKYVNYERIIEIE